jgi:hypothetical protein
MVLYRAVSDAEQEDIKTHNHFRIQLNTLEAKQFFFTEHAVQEYIAFAIFREFIPPYTYILTVSIDDQCFEHVTHDRQELDGHDAISIDKEHLQHFNEFISFVEVYVIENNL